MGLELKLRRGGPASASRRAGELVGPGRGGGVGGGGGGVRGGGGEGGGLRRGGWGVEVKGGG